MDGKCMQKIDLARTRTQNFRTAVVLGKLVGVQPMCSICCPNLCEPMPRENLTKNNRNTTKEKLGEAGTRTPDPVATNFTRLSVGLGGRSWHNLASAQEEMTAWQRLTLLDRAGWGSCGPHTRAGAGLARSTRGGRSRGTSSAHARSRDRWCCSMRSARGDAQAGDRGSGARADQAERADSRRRAELGDAMETCRTRWGER
ncbi:hypothetical protein D1007_18590 [Hordeum vulgare]|nr:hypothetical protein D1007_18590 [Hordeum vulgare]